MSSWQKNTHVDFVWLTKKDNCSVLQVPEQGSNTSKEIFLDEIPSRNNDTPVNASPSQNGTNDLAWAKKGFFLKK